MDEQAIEQLGKFLENKHNRFVQAKTGIGLIITDKCPVGCIHCISNNSLQKGGVPDQEILGPRIDSLSKLNIFERIIITGGEPFYTFGLLKTVVHYSAFKNFRVSTVTSAYWANSVEKAKKSLSILKKSGLETLAISMDIYHHEKIPYSNIIHVLEACHQLDIPNTVVFTWSGNREMDQDLLDSFKSSLPEHLKNTLRITEGSMLISGRALKNRLGPKPGSGNENDPVICQSMGKIIRSDGQVALCCGADLPENSPLLAGHIDTDTIECLLKSMHSNHLIPFIEVFGLRWMAERLKEAYPDFEFRKDGMNTPNRCNICRKMFAEKRNSEFFAGLIRKKYILDQIRGRYLLYYGHQYQETGN